MPDRTMVDRFIEALGMLEQTRDPEPLVELFADGCELSNALLPGVLRGHDGARAFWTSYRANFHDIRSSFRMILDSGAKAALEWRSVGSTREGNPVEYEGTTILEHDDDAITRFVAYFDPRAVGRSVERGLHAE